MAAGVGPSSTVARQTPVRKHVVGGSGRALARDLHPLRHPAMDGFLLPSLSFKSRRVRAADSPSLSSRILRIEGNVL